MSRIFVTFFRILCTISGAAAAGAVVLYVCGFQIFHSESVFTGSGNFEIVANQNISKDMVLLGGRSVGVKLDVEDVLIVGLEEIKTEDGETINPGLSAGLQIGDMIIAIDGVEVHSADDVLSIIEDTDKESVCLKIGRKNEIRYVDVEPVKSAEDGKCRLGVWVKEKTAGIGTLTYYRPYDGSFGALGHGITDAETGSVLKVADGQLLNAKVLSLKEGKKGDPGEIRGIFYEADEPLGSLVKNTEYGLFGDAYADLTCEGYEEPVYVADPDEIKKGDAWILTTIEKDKIEKFTIKIEKINKDSEPTTKSMVIRVTDDRLIDKSGGIVQGMSGSPIVQNGKLIGAVTHVFVNDPTRGYGIFAETMIEQSER